MSFDELPPDSDPSRPSAAEDPNTEPEASSPDAPPAASARRRRAKPAGSDAASSSTETRSTPASRRRSKPKTTEDLSATATPVEPKETIPSTGAAETGAEANPRKSRTPRRAAKPAAETTPPVEAAETAAPSVPDAEAAVPTRPARTPRRSRTKAAAAETDTPVAAAEPSLPQEASATVEETETPAPSPAPSRRSSRGARSRKPAAPAVQEDAVSETTTPAEPLTETAEGAEAAAESVSPPTTERSRRRRPTSRSRRAAATPAEEATAATEITPALETTSEAETEAAPETAAGTEAPAAAPSRSRRNRRSGRNRRAVKEEKAETEEAEAPAAVAPLETPIEIQPDPIDLTVGAHLVLRNGMPEIHINGVAVPPLLFFGNMEGQRNQQRVISEVRRAAQAGAHLHSTLVELPCPLSEATQALDEIDQVLRAMLDADPQGYVMPRIVFVPARGWKREYPTEISTYADGTTGDPALTSERFWREAEHSLETLINHLRDYEWGERIFGYHLERGEWFQPADQGYDRSTANRDAFRDWLREKYKNNLVALRAAWYDGDVQFHTAEIPPILAKPNPQRAFYETRRERRIIDFHEFTSESTANRLIALAKAVKKASKHQALVSVCYGYTFEFGHSFSGHLALGLLESSPAIDLICGPPSYRDRKPGGAASFPAPVDSPPLHGKLWLSEDDTKTWLAPAQQEEDDFNPRLGDRFQTEQAQARALGRVMAHATAIGFMDLWGEGWLDDESIWERIKAFNERYSATLRLRERPRMPDVIAIIDERSLLHVQRGEPFFRKLTNGLRDTLQKAGVSYGTYLQSDLLADSFPTEAKLYLFLTPYRLTTEQRAAIKEKLQGGGKTLAWLYAPGACEERPTVGGVMEEAATGTVGIVLRQQEWNSEVGSRVIDPRHPITERLNSREIGTRERLNPSFYAEDPDAHILAEYQGSGLPSLAVKNCGTWRSVFVGDPVLTLDLLRGICRYAGVHLWTGGGEDVVSIGNGWITVHAVRDGHRTLRLPEATGLYDLNDQRLIAEGLREHRYFLRNGMTRTFYVGTPERMQSLGLPNAASVGRERRPMVPQQPREPAEDLPVEEVSVLPPLPALPDAPLNKDVETLRAVLSLDLSQIDFLPADDMESYLDTLSDEDEEETPAAEGGPLPGLEGIVGEMIANGRRRRRRGGRGRGRRRPEGHGGETPAPTAEGAGNSSDNGAVPDLPSHESAPDDSNFELDQD